MKKMSDYPLCNTHTYTEITTTADRTPDAGIIHRNICAEYGLEVPGSRWETHPKVI